MVVRGDAEWFEPSKLAPLLGDEEFIGLDATVLDFWRFALPDLRMNNARGYLAEFLVHRALGLSSVRIEWDAADVRWGDIAIEVKSAAYVQSWAQRAPSRIVFQGLKGRTWSPSTGYSPEPSYNADIYVFAVQTVQDHRNYDPLNVGDWKFYVLPKAELELLGQRSMALATIEARTNGVNFDQLRSALEGAATVR